MKAMYIIIALVVFIVWVGLILACSRTVYDLIANYWAELKAKFNIKNDKGT